MSELTPDHLTEIARENHGYARAEAMERLRFQVGIADTGMKALMLVNGGALVALFTLVGALGASSGPIGVEPAGLWWAFGAFVGGLVSALLVHLFAFLSQADFYRLAMFEAWREQEAAVRGAPTEISAKERAMFGRGMASYGIAVAVSIVSISLFATGAYFALASFLTR